MEGLGKIGFGGLLGAPGSLGRPSAGGIEGVDGTEGEDGRLGSSGAPLGAPEGGRPPSASKAIKVSTICDVRDAVGSQCAGGMEGVDGTEGELAGKGALVPLLVPQRVVGLPLQQSKVSTSFAMSLLAFGSSGSPSAGGMEGVDGTEGGDGRLGSSGAPLGAPEGGRPPSAGNQRSAQGVRYLKSGCRQSAGGTEGVDGTEGGDGRLGSSGAPLGVPEGGRLSSLARELSTCVSPPTCSKKQIEVGEMAGLAALVRLLVLQRVADLPLQVSKVSTSFAMSGSDLADPPQAAWTEWQELRGETAAKGALVPLLVHPRVADLPLQAIRGQRRVCEA